MIRPIRLFKTEARLGPFLYSWVKVDAPVGHSHLLDVVNSPINMSPTDRAPFMYSDPANSPAGMFHFGCLPLIDSQVISPCAHPKSMNIQAFLGGFQKINNINHFLRLP